jgi:hypothetical protein
MYPLGDADRRKGSNCPILMISSEHWNLTKHQAPFRKDLKDNTIQKLTQFDGSHQPHHAHHLESFRHPFVVTILGSDHLNYCDMVYLSSPLLMTRANYLGSTNPYHFSVAKDHLVLRFFIASASSIRHPSPTDPPLSPKHKADSQDLLETSPLHNEEGMSSPHSITIMERIHGDSHLDVERLFRYCNISKNTKMDHGPSLDLSLWSAVEPIPESLVSYLERNLVDESSLPHCYDDEFFNQVNQQL